MQEVKAICPICYDNTNDMRTLMCEHGFCEECLLKYVESRVMERENSYYCPVESCYVKINQATLVEILADSDYLSAYSKNIDDGSTSLRGVVLCPSCERRCARGDLKLDATCHYCQIDFCGVCTEIGGCGDVCDKEQDLLLELEDLENAMGSEVIKCPRCACVLWKEDGCSAVRCTYCKIKFCWQCLKTEHQLAYHSHNCSNFNTYVKTTFGDEESDGENID